MTNRFRKQMFQIYGFFLLQIISKVFHIFPFRKYFTFFFTRKRNFLTFKHMYNIHENILCAYDNYFQRISKHFILELMWQFKIKHKIITFFSRNRFIYPLDHLQQIILRHTIMIKSLNFRKRKIKKTNYNLIFVNFFI